MRKLSLLYIALASFAVLGIANYVALSMHLYFSIWWFDILMHTLAGFAGGLATVWFLFDSTLFYKRTPTILESISVALAAILVVGVAWEIFEYANGLISSTEDYKLDVIHDLIADLVGAMLAGLVGAMNIFRTKGEPGPTPLTQ